MYICVYIYIYIYLCINSKITLYPFIQTPFMIPLQPIDRLVHSPAHYSPLQSIYSVLIHVWRKARG